MKNIIEICFQKWEPINRKEYFFGNVLIIFICIVWAIISPLLIGNLTWWSDLYITILFSSVPMLLFFSYCWVLITWKRWKDFCKSNFWIYFFIIMLFLATWSPLLWMFFPKIIFNLYMFIFWIIINISVVVMWLIFQFSKTKNQKNRL